MVKKSQSTGLLCKAPKRLPTSRIDKNIYNIETDGNHIVAQKHNTFGCTSLNVYEYENS